MHSLKPIIVIIFILLLFPAVTPSTPSIIETDTIYEHIGSYEQLTFERTLEVNLPDNFIPQEHFAMNDKTYERQTQQSTNTFQTQSGDIDYLIITDEIFWNSFNENFRDWKIAISNRINSLEIVNTSTIYADPDTWVYGKYGDANPSNPWIITPSDNISLFNDSQCKIRNFIRKYVTEKNTSYILLAGNRNYLPVRMATTYGHSGPSGNWYNQTHASDIYYSNLNYSMNNNSNSKWMENKFGDGVYWATVSEWDEIDWGYDVLVGRVLIDSEANCLLWINKTKNYVESSDVNYILNGMIATKDVDNNIDDYVWTRIGDEFSGNINFVNSQNISQAQWNIADDYCNGAVEGWGGIALIYHSGHGGTFWTPYQPSNTNNSLIPNFMYTEGCHSANFGSQTSSRTEQWMKDDGGVFAGISNSAYGWFIASTWYGEEMMSLMFNETRGELEPNFCKAHFDSRENVGWELHSVAPMIFKSTNFFGDPEITFNYLNDQDPWNNSCPTISNVFPANKSSYAPVYSWNAYINDSDSNLTSGTIICSSGDNLTWSDQPNGIRTLYFSDILSYGNNYTIWINLTDETCNVNETYWFIAGYPTQDINQDGKVGYLDASLLLSKYGTTGSPGWINEDINIDGKVDYLDISLLISRYREQY